MKLWVHSLYILIIGFLVAVIVTRPPEIKFSRGSGHESDASIIVENVNTNEYVLNQEKLSPDSELSINRPGGKYFFDDIEEQQSLKEDVENSGPVINELIDEIMVHQQEAKIHERIDQLESKFEREPTDQDWAMAQEQNLSDLFILNEELRDVTVASVECRESLCRVRLDSGDADSLTTMMKIQRSINQQDWQMEDAKTYLRNSDASGYNFTLYTER